MNEASLSGCPSVDDLVRVFEGARGDASLASIEAHVARCERCTAVIAGFGALRRSGGATARDGGSGHAGAVADSHERTRPRRELESAATVSAAELPPALRSGSHAGVGADSGPRSTPGPRSDPASRNITVPRSPSGARWEAAPGAPAPLARPRRRIAPIAIAGVAAAGGVAAVLLGARALSRKPARPPAGAGSTTAEAPGSAAPAPAPGPGELRVEPIAPGSGDTARPAGVPLDPPPHAPAAKTVATSPAPATGPYTDLSSFVTDIQKAIRLHDARTCKRLIAGLPGNIPSASRFYFDSSAAYCDMLAGDCAGGTARLTRALTAQGVAAQPSVFADQYCPIEGPLDARLERLRTQISAHTMGAMMAETSSPRRRGISVS